MPHLDAVEGSTGNSPAGRLLPAPHCSPWRPGQLLRAPVKGSCEDLEGKWDTEVQGAADRKGKEPESSHRGSPRAVQQRSV